MCYTGGNYGKDADGGESTGSGASSALPKLKPKKPKKKDPKDFVNPTAQAVPTSPIPRDRRQGGQRRSSLLTHAKNNLLGSLGIY